MAEAQLRQFLDKVRQLNAFVALSEADPRLRQELSDCAHHDEVVALARRCGFEIGRRWGEPLPASPLAEPAEGVDVSDPTGPSVDPAGPDAGPPDAVRPAFPLVESGAPPGRAAGAATTVPQEPGSSQGASASQPWVDRQAFPWGTANPAAVVGGLPGRIDPSGSLFAGACPPPGEECTEVLLQSGLWRLERIHSCDYRSPAGFWYEQPEEEWVMVLQGRASLRFADQTTDHQLQPGDSLWIRAGWRHRVTATDSAPGTIWLALFWPTA